jgi:hypothetical protein
MKFIFVFMCVFLKVNAQSINKNLLLLRVEKENDLMIDKYQTFFFVIELDSLHNPLNDNGMMPVLINDFSDAHLEDCKNGLTFNVLTVFRDELFKGITNYGEENFEKILKNFKSMHFLSSIKIKDLAYNKKINIYYTVMKVDYCVGEQFVEDKRKSCNNGRVVILSSSLTLNNEYKIPKANLYDFFKVIDFNKLIMN